MREVMEEMGVLTRHELDKLMKKLSRERARVLREFVNRTFALKVGEEFYQHFLTSLPTVQEMRQLLNETGTDIRFDIHETINGYTVKRTA